jgi:hypothetical protein
MIPEDKKTSFLDGLKSGVQAMPVYENGNGKKYYGGLLRLISVRLWS